MNEIRLFNDLNSRSIMAEFTVDGFADKTIADVMGTHIIPTGFTINANMVEVGRRIGELNPGYVVKYHI